MDSRPQELAGALLNLQLHTSAPNVWSPIFGISVPRFSSNLLDPCRALLNKTITSANQASKQTRDAYQRWFPGFAFGPSEIYGILTSTGLAENRFLIFEISKKGETGLAENRLLFFEISKKRHRACREPNFDFRNFKKGETGLAENRFLIC